MDKKPVIDANRGALPSLSKPTDSDTASRSNGSATAGDKLVFSRQKPTLFQRLINFLFQKTSQPLQQGQSNAHVTEQLNKTGRDVTPVLGQSIKSSPLPAISPSSPGVHNNPSLFSRFMMWMNPARQEVAGPEKISSKQPQQSTDNIKIFKGDVSQINADNIVDWVFDNTVMSPAVRTAEAPTKTDGAKPKQVSVTIHTAPESLSEKTMFDNLIEMNEAFIRRAYTIALKGASGSVAIAPIQDRPLAQRSSKDFSPYTDKSIEILFEVINSIKRSNPNLTVVTVAVNNEKDLERVKVLSDQVRKQVSQADRRVQLSNEALMSKIKIDKRPMSEVDADRKIEWKSLASGAAETTLTDEGSGPATENSPESISPPREQTELQKLAVQIQESKGSVSKESLRLAYALALKGASGTVALEPIEDIPEENRRSGSITHNGLLMEISADTCTPENISILFEEIRKAKAENSDLNEVNIVVGYKLWKYNMLHNQIDDAHEERSEGNWPA